MCNKIKPIKTETKLNLKQTKRRCGFYLRTNFVRCPKEKEKHFLSKRCKLEKNKRKSSKDC